MIKDKEGHLERGMVYQIVVFRFFPRFYDGELLLPPSDN